MITIEEIVREEASRFFLRPEVVLALIEVESNGNEYAWNPEPHFRYFWNVRSNQAFRRPTEEELDAKTPPKDFPCLAGDPDQEWWAQQASWGLMQVMGAVAREQGFRGPYLSELCDPGVNIDHGCRKLWSQLRWAKGDYEQALAAYNGGRGGNEIKPFRNAAYAQKVLAKV